MSTGKQLQTFRMRIVSPSTGSNSPLQDTVSLRNVSKYLTSRYGVSLQRDLNITDIAGRKSSKIPSQNKTHRKKPRLVTTEIPVQSGTFRYNPVHSGTIRYILVHSGTIRYNPVQSGTFRYNPVQGKLRPYQLVSNDCVTGVCQMVSQVLQ